MSGAVAAERLQISAPAAAKRLRQLESLSVQPLLARSRRGVVATDAGVRLYPVARDLLAQRARAIDALANTQTSDPLRIAGMRQVIGRVAAPAAEDLLRQTEELLAAVFHATSECVAITQADNGEIFEINDATVRLIGYRQDDLRGGGIGEVQLWEDIERRDELVRQTIASGQPAEGDLVVVTRSGRRRPVHARFHAIMLHGTAYLLLVLQALTG